MADVKTPSKDPQARDEFSGRSGGGDSAGGAYPNPHKGDEGNKDGFMASGGQSDMAYYGKGQLGEKKTGDNPNSPSREDDDQD